MCGMHASAANTYVHLSINVCQRLLYDPIDSRVGCRVATITCCTWSGVLTVHVAHCPMQDGAAQQLGPRSDRRLLQVAAHPVAVPVTRGHGHHGSRVALVELYHASAHTVACGRHGVTVQ